MPQFSYQAIDSQGKTTDGVLDGPDRESVVKILRAKGFSPLEVESNGSAIFQESSPSGAMAGSLPVKKTRKGKLKLQDRTMFTRQLATLVKAGLPLTRSLGILRNQSEKQALKDLVGELRDAIVAGQSFSEALSKHPDFFPPIYINMVKVGELGGCLDAVLEQLAKFLDKEQEARRNLINALSYPLMIIGLGFMLAMVLLLFIFPKIIPVFDVLGADLPLFTQVVIGAIDILMKYGWIAALLVTGLVIWGIRYKNTPEGSYQWGKFMLALPGLGEVIRKVSITRFAQSLGTLVRSGVAVLPSMEMVSQTLGNEVLRRALVNSCEKVRKGEGISGPLSQSGVFPEMVITLIAVGEESGKLDEMLDRISETYEQEVDAALHRFISLFEPLVIVCIAVGVGTMVIAFLLPILSISENLG